MPHKTIFLFFEVEETFDPKVIKDKLHYTYDSNPGVALKSAEIEEITLTGTAEEKIHWLSFFNVWVLGADVSYQYVKDGSLNTGVIVIPGTYMISFLNVPRDSQTDSFGKAIGDAGDGDYSLYICVRIFNDNYISVICEKLYINSYIRTGFYLTSSFSLVDYWKE